MLGHCLYSSDFRMCSRSSGSHCRVGLVLNRQAIVGDCSMLSGLCSNRVAIDARNFTIAEYAEQSPAKWIAKNSARSVTEAVSVLICRPFAKSFHICCPLLYAALVRSCKLLEWREAMHGENPMFSKCLLIFWLQAFVAWGCRGLDVGPMVETVCILLVSSTESLEAVMLVLGTNVVWASWGIL